MTAKFTWLGEATVTRSREGSGGVTLEKGKTYDLTGFDGAVVQEWVMTGHAAWVVDGPIAPASKDTTLEVHNATIKVKTPKIGAGL